MKTQRRVSAAVIALLLSGAGIAMGATPAQAVVVDVEYACKTPIGDKTAVSPIDIKAVKEGSGYKLTMSFQKGVSSSPIELGKGAMSPSAVITLGGADSGSVPVSGPANPEPIPANTPIKISDLSGTYTPKKSGKVTFTAGVLTIKAMGTTTTCTPANKPGPSLELDVTAGGPSPDPSTSSSPSPTPQPSTSSSPSPQPSTSASPSPSPQPSTSSSGATDFPGTTVDVAYDCGAMVAGGMKGRVTISAKKNGGSYDLTVTTAKGAMASPMALPAGALKPSMDVKLGGADSGMVKVTGPANAEPIPDKAPVSLSDMKGTYKPGKTGRTTLSPDKLTIDVTMAPGAAPIVVPCIATSSAVSLTLDTTAQEGGSGSSGSSGATGSSGTTGNLAQTGAEDGGGIKALALVAGTVILLGAAVFTFTPWRRLRARQ